MNVGHQPQEGRFAAAVVADEPEEGAGLDVEVDVAQHPEVVDILVAAEAEDGLLQAARPVALEAKALRDAGDGDFADGHGSSLISMLRARK